VQYGSWQPTDQAMMHKLESQWARRNGPLLLPLQIWERRRAIQTIKTETLQMAHRNKDHRLGRMKDVDPKP
jgi:hypothetical protein